jgi:hypothetical protein
MVGLVRYLTDITDGWKAYLKRANNQSYITEDGDTNDTIKNAAIPSDFMHRMKTRNPTKAMGFDMFSGELKNPTKFMQNTQHPEVVQNAYQILAALKNTGETGQNINSISAMGGATNIAGALASGSSYQTEITQENEENEENPLEAWLRALYRELEGLEPLDNAGNETAEYVRWRNEYILTLGADFIAAYNSYGATS